MGLPVGALAQRLAWKTSANQVTAVTMTVLVIIIINPRAGGLLQVCEPPT